MKLQLSHRSLEQMLLITDYRARFFLSTFLGVLTPPPSPQTAAFVWGCGWLKYFEAGSSEDGFKTWDLSGPAPHLQSQSRSGKKPREEGNTLSPLMISLNWLWEDKRKGPSMQEGDGIWEETDRTADVFLCKITTRFIFMKQCFLLVFVPLIPQRGIFVSLREDAECEAVDVQRTEILPPQCVSQTRNRTDSRDADSST